MHNFGFKIVDRDPLEIQPILGSALEHHTPVEIGFYFHNAQADEIIWKTLRNQDIPINTHLDHRVYHLSDLHEHLRALAVEIDHVQRLGSDYSIVHVTPSPFTIARDATPAFFRQLVANLHSLDNLCKKHGYAVYVENTFGGIDFYRDLFARIATEGLTRIHFCFDMGHAKIWSGNSVSDWMAFLQKLTGKGFKLHFHLHNNRGKFDDHLSFAESVEEGLNERDTYTGEYNYIQTLQTIEKRFPDSRKVFEVKADVAIQNMDYIATQLGGFS